jgi:hypothetical protein
MHVLRTIHLLDIIMVSLDHMVIIMSAPLVPRYARASHGSFVEYFWIAKQP